MDRRLQRRGIMMNLAVIEVEVDRLAVLAEEAETAGDPILASNLFRYCEKLTVIVDQMYEWAGKI